MTLASLRSLSTSSAADFTLTPAERFAGSTTFRVFRRGVGSTPICTRDLDADGVCDPEEVETAFVDENRNFLFDFGEPRFPYERFSAKPARRLVRTAQAIAALGGRPVVQSICRESFRPTIDALLGNVRAVAVGDCRR